MSLSEQSAADRIEEVELTEAQTLALELDAVRHDLQHVVAERDRAERHFREWWVDVKRLGAALQVCEAALGTTHVIREDTSDEWVPLLHAAQQAAQAWETDWTPERTRDDLPGWVFDDTGFGPPREGA